MKQRVADYIADFLAGHGINTVFTVVGGGAMHLNDALGHNHGLTCIYNHHEQACAIAAESYARIHNKIATVCVTTGPGGTNALTGVVGGWLDSIPMLIISGQVRYDTTARSTGLNLRAMGDQEFDICRAVSSMTKYCEMVISPKDIRRALERALHEATSGRPGPCWLDIPMDVQGAYVETEDMLPYDSSAYDRELPPKVTDETVDKVLTKIKEAKRPVLYAGNGIRWSGGYEVFRRVADLLNIPVVTGWDSIDLMPDEHPLYVGRGGNMGDRPGNFAVQNSDLVLAIGNRLSIRQVGYAWKSWAREAFVIMNDIDRLELQKPTVHVDMRIWADAKDLLLGLEKKLDKATWFPASSWHEACTKWKMNYPVVSDKQLKQEGLVNVYAFVKTLSEKLAEGQTTVVGNGSACVVGSQAYVIKEGQRFIINSAIASMGYDLPAAIGASIASPGKKIICLTGDGSIQMNLQELATIAHHRLPVCIFLINNGGYHSIRQTQQNHFSDELVGVGEDSHDLSFPDMEKLAMAYDLPYEKISSNDSLEEGIEAALKHEAPLICEVYVDKEQAFEPKSAAKKMADGSMVSTTLENLSPFLPTEEVLSNLYIEPLGDLKGGKQ